MNELDIMWGAIGLSPNVCTGVVEKYGTEWLILLAIPCGKDDHAIFLACHKDAMLPAPLSLISLTREELKTIRRDF